MISNDGSEIHGTTYIQDDEKRPLYILARVLHSIRRIITTGNSDKINGGMNSS